MPEETYIYVGLCSIGAGFLTASIGFGGAVFMMLFFPLFLPFVPSTCLASTIVYGGVVLLAIEYRKHILWKELWLPVLLYVACGIPTVYFVSKNDISGLLPLFSAFIIFIGLWNLCGVMWPGKISLKKNPVTTVLCSSLSGIATGLFGIGGPPMAGYFMAVTGDDKNAYIGTIQTFFAISMIFTISARFISGIMPVSYIPLTAVGIVTSLIGKRIGTRVLQKVNAKLLKIGICLFMIFSQLINFIS